MSFLDYLIEGADDGTLGAWQSMMEDGLAAAPEDEAESFRQPLRAIEAELDRRAKQSGGAS